MWANLPIAVALVAVGTWIFLHVDIQAKNLPGKGELLFVQGCKLCAVGQHIPTAERSGAAAAPDLCVKPGWQALPVHYCLQATLEPSL